MSECRYLGNKDYLFQNNYKIGGYVPVYYGNNSYLIFESNNDNHSNLIMSPKLEKYSYNQVTEKFKIMNWGKIYLSLKQIKY